jgi:hypothetical protein
METYNPSDLLGVNVIAGKPVAIYTSIFNEPILTAPTGSPLGTIFSYVIEGGNFWWQMDNTQFGNYYIKNSPGVFNNVALLNAGVLTQEQQIEQANEPGFFEGLLSGGGDIIKLAIVAVVVAGVVYFSIGKNK